ncbi:MAG: ABC transporter permease, partial [Caldilineaceae bacterium]|nr:ABC transporter permease [Caldilineaceae bacterium]
MSQESSLSRPLHTGTAAQGQQSVPRRAADEERVHLRRSRMRTVPLLIFVCFLVIGTTIGAALLATWLAPFPPQENHLVDRLLPPFTVTEANVRYLLGTDALGRDVLSRLIFGARVSLAIGFVGTLIGLIVGSLSGLISGFIGGLFDEMMMFLVDAYIAIPFLIVALTAIAIFGSSIPVLVVLAGFSGWASYTRLARG